MSPRRSERQRCGPAATRLELRRIRRGPVQAREREPASVRAGAHLMCLGFFGRSARGASRMGIRASRIAQKRCSGQRIQKRQKVVSRLRRQAEAPDREGSDHSGAGDRCQRGRREERRRGLGGGLLGPGLQHAKGVKRSANRHGRTDQRERRCASAGESANSINRGRIYDTREGNGRCGRVGEWGCRSGPVGAAAIPTAAALLRRQPPRPADRSGGRRHVQPDLDERQGLRRDLLRRELLLRRDARA